MPDHLRVPEADWSKIRTNNVAERAFRFVRQRQCPIGAFTNEESGSGYLRCVRRQVEQEEEPSPEAIDTT